MTDYEKLIDAETLAFIERTNAAYPPDAVKLNIEQQRKVYEDLCRQFFQGYPAGVTAEDANISGVPVRHYACSTTKQAKAHIVYMHGGGFVVGNLESHDDICAELSQRTGLPLTAIDYALSPEKRHPASYDDCLAVIAELCNTSEQPLILVGDSAGGNLAAAVTHTLRDRIKGQVLIYPVLGSKDKLPSYIEHENAPLLKRSDVKFYQAIRTGSNIPVADPSYAPLDDLSFEGLPETYLFAAECDPLRDEIKAYADAMTAAGCKVKATIEPGLVHGYLRARTSVTRAKESFTRIVEAIAALAE